MINLNNKQKYIIWTAIRGVHSEIRLEKCFHPDDLLVMLHEVYRHYSFSFSRQYLEIYYTSWNTLRHAKDLALIEIKADFRDGNSVIDQIVKLNVLSLYKYPTDNINYRNHMRANVYVPKCVGIEGFETILNDINESLAKSNGRDLSDAIVESICLNNEFNYDVIDKLKLLAKHIVELGRFFF